MVGVGIARAKGDGAGCGVADSSRLIENTLHPCVRGERFPFLDADGSEQAAGLVINRLQRLLLHNAGDLSEECHIVGGNHIEHGAGEVDEGHSRRIRRTGQRVDTKILLDGLDPRTWVAIHEESAKAPEVTVGAGAQNEVAARDGACVTRREQQVLTALTLV